MSDLTVSLKLIHITRVLINTTIVVYCPTIYRDLKSPKKGIR